ncbi:MAG: tetratricopeptide repeat protein [Gammaproteobacteria bacterium]
MDAWTHTFTLKYSRILGYYGAGVWFRGLAHESATGLSSPTPSHSVAQSPRQNLYWSRGDLKQAEAVFLHSLALHETLGDQAGMADNCANLGSVYWAQRDWMKAEVRYWQALRLNKAIDRKGKLTSNYQHLGLLYQAQGEFEKAEAMYVRALRLYQRLGNEAQARTTERLIGAERKAR